MRPIDADSLIEKCGEWYTEEGPEEGYIGPLKYLLNKQPTIEPKQGEWTIKNGELAFWDVCSVCGKMVMHKAPFYNYCPNCGARMKGADDESLL